MIDERQINQWFSIPEISREQAEALNEVMKHAKRLAIAVNEHMPDGEDKNSVIQNMRQNIITIELAIRYRWKPLIRTAETMN
jgi:hypothetical protein